MKHFCVAILCSLIFMACQPSTEKSSNPELLERLDAFYESQDYFKFKALLDNRTDQLSDLHNMYYHALLYHVFNDQQRSNDLITSLVDDHQSELSDSLIYKLYSAKLMNHINLYEYNSAYLCSKEIISDYAYLEDSNKVNSLINELNIWEALKNTPKQELIISADSKIPLFIDKVGLMNINTFFDGDTINFLFDTGANFSVITESVAAELGMEVLESDFYVTAATGNKVKSKVAVAPEFSISDIIIKNAVFLVFKDEDFSFPQYDYYPNGAIGFPIIEAFEEIKYDKSGDIYVAKEPVEYHYDNLALDGLMPMVAIHYNGDTINFSFDTGASTTTLYRPFYEKYKIEIDSLFSIVDFTAGSGGGSKDFKGFQLDSLTLTVAGSAAILHNTKLHKEDVFENVEAIHGNFGQDFIKQFDAMIISFKHASVVFEK